MMVSETLDVIIGNAPMMRVTALDVPTIVKIEKVHIRMKIDKRRMAGYVILRNATGALDGVIVIKPNYVLQICNLIRYVMKYATMKNVSLTIITVSPKVVVTQTVTGCC